MRAPETKYVALIDRHARISAPSQAAEWGKSSKLKLTKGVFAWLAKPLTGQFRVNRAAIPECMRFQIALIIFCSHRAVLEQPQDSHVAPKCAPVGAAISDR